MCQHSKLLGLIGLLQGWGGGGMGCVSTLYCWALLACCKGGGNGICQHSLFMPDPDKLSDPDKVLTFCFLFFKLQLKGDF